MATGYLLSRWVRKNRFKREAGDVYQLYRFLQLEKYAEDGVVNYRGYYKRWKEIHEAVTVQVCGRQLLKVPSISSMLGYCRGTRVIMYKHAQVQGVDCLLI